MDGSVSLYACVRDCVYKNTYNNNKEEKKIESERQVGKKNVHAHQIDGNDTKAHSVLAVDHSLHANNMSMATLEQH